jgi:hypothetical protein
MNNKNSIEKIFSRVEKEKIELKQSISKLYMTLGAFELSVSDYNRLSFLISIANEYLRMHGLPLNSPISVLPQILRDDILKIYLRGLNRKINSMGQWERLFFMVDMSREAFTSDMLEQLIPSWFRLEDVVNISIFGRRGYGKTDFAFKISEYIEGNYVIASNVKTDCYDYITKASDLLRWVIENWDLNKLFIFDELGIHADSRRSMSKENVSLSHMLHIARKLRVNMIAIAQEEGDVDKRLRQYSTIIVRKTAKESAEVEITIKEKYFEVKEIKRTAIKYDTRDIAEFDFDIDFNDFLDIFNLGDKQIMLKEFERRLSASSFSFSEVLVLKTVKKHKKGGKKKVFIKTIANETGLSNEEIGRILRKYDFEVKKSTNGRTALNLVSVDDELLSKVEDVEDVEGV